jgi:hypothetical protein
MLLRVPTRCTAAINLFSFFFATIFNMLARGIFFMPSEKITRMSGVSTHNVGRGIDHAPQAEHSQNLLNKEEMREFLREEQKEGVHSSLKGKRF